jgi:hypothetical protein
MREMKLLSDAPVSDARMMQFIPTPAVEFSKIHCQVTAALSLFYGEAQWPVREAVEIHCEGWPKFRRLVVWKMMNDERMSLAMEDVRIYYFQLFMRHPRFAFTKRLPRQVEDGWESNGLMLMQAEWALRGCLMVGG